MKANLPILLALLVSNMLFGQTSTVANSNTTRSSSWNQLADRFFDDFFKLNPTQATEIQTLATASCHVLSGLRPLGKRGPITRSALRRLNGQP